MDSTREDAGVGKKLVRAILVTSQPVQAYGGVRLPEEFVESIAAEMASGAIPMYMGHDIARPLAAKMHNAGTERLPDGYLAAWAEFEVDAEQWASFEAELERTGAPGGMSISMSRPLTTGVDLADAHLTVAADAHHFSEDEIQAAVSELRKLDSSVQGEYLYQFAFEPPAVVAIELIWSAVATLGPNIIASAIYDASRAFFLRPRPTGVTLEVLFRHSRRGRKKLDIKITAADADQMRAAIEGLPAILRSGAEGTFTSQDGNKPEALPAAPSATELD